MFFSESFPDSSKLLDRPAEKLKLPPVNTICWESLIFSIISSLFEQIDNLSLIIDLLIGT